MNIRKAIRNTLFALVAVTSTGLWATENVHLPLSSPDQWLLLKYSSLEPNKVSFFENRLKIEVAGSASPVIYPFQNPRVLESISLNLKVNGSLNLDDQLQGSSGVDDFVFRLGVVYEGDQTLNFFQRAIAAKWVKTLFDLAPDDAGVDHIAFFNVYSDGRLAGKERYHPASRLMKEMFVESVSEGNTVTLEWTPDKSKRVLGLWISSDGDDTNSSYFVEISELRLFEKSR